MIQFSLAQKLKMLVDIILSSSFFLATIIFGTIFVVMLIMNIRKKEKINKKLFILAWLFVIILVFIKYYNTLFTMLDNLVENIFVSIYFPNLATYVAILLITNFIFVASIIKKNISKFIIALNSISFIGINVLFFFIADIVVKENIDIYSKLTIYSNSNLLVLLELSTGLFTLWLIILFVYWVIIKLISINKEPVTKSIPQQKENITVENKQQEPIIIVQKEEKNVNQSNNYLPKQPENIEVIDFKEEKFDYENLYNRYMRGDSSLTLQDYKNLKEYLLKSR